MLTGFMKRGAEKEVLAIGSMAQEKYFREAVLFNYILYDIEGSEGGYLQ